MKSFVITCVAVSLFLVNQASMATIIDFEAPPYSITGGSGGTAQITGQDGWNQGGGGGPEGGLIDTGTVFNGSQSLNTRGIRATGPGQTRYFKGNITGIGGQNGSSINWYGRRSGVDAGTSSLYYFGNAVSSTTSAVSVNVGFQGDKIQRYDRLKLDGNGNPSPGNILSTETTVVDEWYNFTAVLDFTNKLFDLTVKSTSLSFGESGYLDLSYTGVGFRNLFQADVTSVLVLAQASATNNYYTDDIAFNAIPEPSSFALFLLASVGAVMLRRRQ